MSKYSPGDKITIKTTMLKGRRGYNQLYPQVGWTGRLVRVYDDCFGHRNYTEWVIQWDEGIDCGTGDLVHEWMFADPEPKIIKQYGIVNFMRSINEV